MEMKVQCARCSAELHVPEDATGPYARCPVCNATFVVPSPDELFDETVSTWIEQEVEEELLQRQRRLDERMDSSRPGSVPAADAGEGVPDEGPAAVEPDAEPKRVVEAREVAADTPDEADEAGAQDDLDVQIEMPGEEKKKDHRQPDSRGRGRRDEASRGTASAAPDRTEIDLSDETVGLEDSLAGMPNVELEIEPTVRADRDQAQAASYPTDLHVRAPIPHLIVLECSQDGVRIGFDSAWLDHPGFRLSMPERCVYGTDAKYNELVVRPLAFIDRSQAQLRSPRELERGHEHHLHDRRAPRELLASMGVVESMPPPFHLPMPYYVTSKDGRPSLRCSTKSRPDGGITCRVLIPDGEYALEWLLRVNGMCGAEYGLLKRDVELLWSGPWSQLSDACRQRIAAWCPFEPGEKFHLYCPDAEFSQRDQGLAGVVVTDRRFVYCKYHHRGQVQLDDPVTLKLRRDGELAKVTLIMGDERARVGRMAMRDLKKLMTELEGTAIQIDTGK